MRVIWSPHAVDQVESIGDHIARDKPIAARRWIERILSATDPLAEHPNLGRMVPEVGRRDVRELIEGNYRIVYRVKEKTVSILTVRHSRRLLDFDEIKE